MSYISAINTLVNPTFIYKGKTLLGEEECGNIEIKGKHVILQTDHMDFREKVLKTIFQKGPATSICDYVIISEEVVLICELKSKNTTSKSVQQKNTARLIKYLLSMLKAHDKIITPLPEIKYACFSNKTRPGQQQSKPNNSKIIKSGTLECDGTRHSSYQLSGNATYLLMQFVT
ncbi:MAG: hypothetical protein H7257_11645 [Taibaiella sp.]|nr:hypothetical protein [Taibaiella sp.]